MNTNATPANVGSNDGLGPLPEARWKWRGSGPRPYEDAYSADQVRDYATRATAGLRMELDRAIDDADRAIEHARRVDAKEREAMRSALMEIRSHWRELGPEHGFDEVLEMACRVLEA